MEIININGEDYVKKSKLDKTEQELNRIKAIVGQSFAELQQLINKEEIKVEKKANKPRKQISKSADDDIYEVALSYQKPWTIDRMTKDGEFFTDRGKKLNFTIKHVLHVQKCIHSKTTVVEARNLRKKFNLNEYVFGRLVYNYQQGLFTTFIQEWNKMTQPVVGLKNRPIQNNPEKRREAGIY